MNFIKKITLFLCLFWNLSMVAQIKYGNPKQKLSKELCHRDFNRLTKLYTDNHPNLQDRRAKREFERFAKTSVADMKDSMSLGSFLWLCDELVTKVECGHSFVWWPDDYGIFPDTLIFPIETWYDGERLFVKDPRNNAQRLSAQDELISINDIPVKDILIALYAHSPSDGNNSVAKRSWVNNMFNTLIAVYFDFPSIYRVEVKSKLGIRSIELDPYIYQARIPKKRKDPMNLEIIDSLRTAVLTVRSFNYYGEDITFFRSFIDSAFQVMKETKIQDLVVDLRGNQGGESYCGAYLIQHLAYKPFQYWATESNPGFQLDLHDTLVPSSNRYRGRPVVLTDGACMSTTGHVLSLIKENQFALLVGEEAGSTFTCNDNSLQGYLPESRLSYRIPRTTFFTSAINFPKDQGILPDINIPDTIESIVLGEDIVLRFVLERIASGKDW